MLHGQCYSQFKMLFYVLPYLGGPLVTSASSDHTCDNTVNSQHPKDIITCSVKTQYTNRLNDGDK